MTSPTIPISDISQVQSDTDEDFVHEDAFTRRRCCFWIPCMQSHRPAIYIRSNWWQPISDNGKNENRHGWWWKGLMQFKKIKEWSELVAGPKWKTFIRQFKKKQSKQSKFQYDPESYSLNFDEGQALTDDDDLFFRDFSSRYASVPISSKSSMDLGKVGLSFT